MTIKTDRRWKAFLMRDEVPAKVLAAQFDWTNEAYNESGDYSDNFIKYKGWWYHLGDFMRCDMVEKGIKWHGAAGDSYFSGTLIEVSNDGESYRIGTYYE